MNAGPRVFHVLPLLILCAPVCAQRSAYVFGRVTDTTAAGIPGASVTAVNQDNGFRRTADTEVDGGYFFSSLDAGAYKITVRKEGFMAMVRFNVKVANLQSVRADFGLTVGAIQETITVEGTEPVPGQEDASIGVRIFRDEIQRLPLNGRGVLGLVEFSPGTNVTPATRGEAGQLTANGQRPNANYFTVDGVSANTGVLAGGLPAQANGGVLPALSAFGSLDSLLPVEAIDVLRVQTANTPGELGRLPGANIELTSRSGSNEFHGGAVYRTRHELLAANDWFANVTGEGRAPLRLHDIAPSFGGPVRRDRTFFFLSYEHMTLRGPYVYRQVVPSVETRDAAPDWVRPALDLYPLPNGASLGRGLAEWNGRNIRPSRIDSGMARVDHSIASRATVFARYNDSPSNNEFGSTEVNRLDLRFRSLTLGLNLRPSRRLVFDVRANESQSDARSSWAKIGSPLSSGCELQALTIFLLNVTDCNVLVRFSIGGVGQVVSGREGDRRQRQFQIVEASSFTTGAHALRFGADYRRMVPIRRDASGVLSAIADDISTFTDKRFLWLGKSDPVNAKATVSELSLWVQDTWRISSRLMVTPGLRWEFNPPVEPAIGPYFLNPETNTVFNENRPLWKLTYRNFAPRLSAAWRLSQSGRTVLRAGGGLFYDSSLSFATDLINSGPLSITQFSSSQGSLFSSLLTYGFQRDLRLPRLSEWNLTLDRKLSAHDAISLGYVGSKGRHLIRREVGGAGNSPTAQVALLTNHGSSDYEGLQAQYRRTVMAGFKTLVSYAWSHSLDDDSSDSALVWAGTGAGARRDHASSDFDLRHSLTAALTYELPVNGTGVGRLFRGWAVDGLLRARSGFPITVLLNEQSQGIGFSNAFRPDRLLNQPVWIGDASAPGGKRINAAAFLAPKPRTQGSLGRNSIAGFGMSQLDVAARREFRWKDRRALEIRVEAFNALNRANFADPVRYLSSPVFGQSTSMLNLMLGTGSPGSGLSPILQTGGARNLQGTLRFRF